MICEFKPTTQTCCKNKQKTTLKFLNDYHKRYSCLAILALPAEHSTCIQEYNDIYNLPWIKGIIIDLYATTPSNLSASKVGRMNVSDRTWDVPKLQANTIIFLGHRRQIKIKMLINALRNNIFWIAYLSLGCLVRENIVSFSLRLLFHYFYQLCPASIFPNLLFYETELRLKKTVHHHDAPLLKIDDFNKGKVLMINNSLAWGGAERQLVNTLIGLKEKKTGYISLLCEHLDHISEKDFYLDVVQKNKIDVFLLNQVCGDYELSNTQKKIYENQENNLQDRIFRTFSRLPPQLSAEIAEYLIALDYFRPEIVHIWQDRTSVIAGLAAVILGVPKIVISSRNMAAYRFNYHLPYMRLGYRALSEVDNVYFLNNSRAGADDYTKWLNLSENKYRVLHNGINTKEFKFVGENLVNSCKKQMRISEKSKVVGSIFRLYAEKDPLLWISTIAAVAKQRNDCVFLLVGAGPLENKIKSYAKKLNISDQLIMPGTEKNASMILSIMDLFLLTSKEEGTPNVIIEAQLCGVPVIATDAGGTAETFINGKTGWLINKREPDLLAERIQFSLDNQQWYDNARVLARQFALEKFSLTKMINSTLEIYNYK